MTMANTGGAATGCNGSDGITSSSSAIGQQQHNLEPRLQTRHSSSQDNFNNSPHQDQELFGQHLLKSRMGQSNQEDFDQSRVEGPRKIVSSALDELDNEICDNESESDGDSSEAAMLVVSSAEEYAAKIIKLQQACLIPLKEDLAEWLNKILKTSQMTTDNFMDRLDNGVIICRLAKIISLWCKQQIEHQESNISNEKNSIVKNTYGLKSANPRTRLQIGSQITSTNLNFNDPLRTSATSQSTSCLIRTSASATNLNNGSHLSSYHSNPFMNNLIRMHHLKIWEDAKCRTFYARDNVCNFIQWSTDFGVNRSVLFESDDLVLHANPRQVVLCLLDVARIAYVKYDFTEAPGLVKFEQEIDRALASERNSIDVDLSNGSGFGLKRNSTNPTRDSLCDVSSSAAEQAKASNDRRASLKSSQRTRASIGDATDELIMRYCRHKEEEAARKRKQEEIEELDRLVKQQQQKAMEPLAETADFCLVQKNDFPSNNTTVEPAEDFEPDSLMPEGNSEAQYHLDDLSVSSTTDLQLTETAGKNFMADHGRIDSLDSGEGPTESASTAHSGSRYRGTEITDAIDSIRKIQPGLRESKLNNNDDDSPSPTPASHPTTTSNSVSENSELSSSRSSLLSNQDCNNSTSNYGRQITSDLDGKVMRIAKNYYGKKATRDVTRLSEGKYKIADRIVFVRLLKGHRVMVRIGGGWDTLENFLFRHKSDPTQVIDPDNLLPLETKISLEKSAQVTPKSTPLRSPASVRIPRNYGRSNSASSTNLSLSNLSYSNLSLASSHHNSTPLRQNKATLNGVRLKGTMNGSSYNSSPSVDQSPRRQIPCLLIHKGQPVHRTPLLPPTPSYNSDGRISIDQQQQRNIPQAYNAQATPSKSLLKKPQHHSNNRAQSQQQQRQLRQNQYPKIPTTPNQVTTKSIHLQRPLASSRAPAFSVTNLYPATLTTNTSNRSVSRI